MSAAYTRGLWVVDTDVKPKGGAQTYMIIGATDVEDGELVAGRLTEANAERIVACVNMHDDLVAALEVAQRYIGAAPAKAMQKISEAIAAAKDAA